MGDINSSHCYDLCDIPFACCDGAGGVSILNITSINGVPPGSGGDGPTPAAPPNTSVQWNNNGAFAGSPQFLWDNTAAHINIAAANPGNPGIYLSEPTNGRTGGLFTDQVGYQLVAGPNTALYLYAPNGIEAITNQQFTFSSDSASGYAYAFGTGASEFGMIIMPNNAVGINLTQPPGYMFEVAGDINIVDPGNVNGYTYRINGIPLDFSGGGGTPAPPDRAVQFNNGGAFGGTFNLVYSTTGNLGIGTSNPEVSVHANGGILSMNYPTTWPDSGPGIMMFVDPSSNGANGSAIYSYNFGPNTAIDLGIYARNLIGNVTTSSFSGRMGIGKAPGANFALDVNGNVTASGCYYILNIPWACLDSNGTSIDLTNIGKINGTAPGGGGGSQTPWLSDIDGANFALTNVQYINANQNISAREFDIYGIPFAEAGIGPGEVQLINISLINGNPYPPPPTPQTPWLSNIDGANHTLQNVSALGINTTAQTNIPLKVSGSPGGILAMFQNTASTSNTQLVLYNDTGNGAGTFTAFGSGSSIFPNCTALNMGANTPAFLILMNSFEMFRVTGLPTRFIGIKQSNPQYALDVTGDVNVTGVYRINGVPLSTGGSQTPWTSNIDGGNFRLFNTSGITIGSSANTGVFSVQGPYSSAAVPGNNFSLANLIAYNSAIGTNNLQLGIDINSGAWIQSSQLPSSTFSLVLNPRGGNVGVGPTGNPSAALDVAGCVRSTNYTAPVSGSGLELAFSSGVGYLVCYDRTNSNYKGLNIGGLGVTIDGHNSPVILQPTGSDVGIGTANPRSLLEIHQPTSSGYQLILSSDSPSAGWGMALQSTTSAFIIDEVGISSRFAIIPGGNVGIGIVAPAAKLDCAGMIRCMGINPVPTTGAGVEIFWNGSSGQIDAYDRAAGVFHALTIQGRGGPVGIGISVLSPSFACVIDGGTQANCNIGFGATGGCSSIQAINDAQSAYVPLCILSNKLGIMNQAPAHTLDVSGDVNCTGGFFVNGTPHLAEVYDVINAMQTQINDLMLQIRLLGGMI